jgi:hypothetical protein
MPLLNPAPIVSLSPLRSAPAPSDGSDAAYEPAATTPSAEDLNGARATSAWSPRPRPSVRTRQVQLSWPVLGGALVAVALVSGGVGYAVSEGRQRGTGDGGGVAGAVSPTATQSPSQTPSTSATPTASHTAGVSASGTATDTATTSVSATPSQSSSAVPTRSVEPSPTSLSGVAAEAARLMVTGPRVAFLAFGDWGRCATNDDPPARRTGGNCDRQRALVPNMEEWAAAGRLDFVMSTGDQFYNGPLSDGDLRWDYSFREVYDTPTLRSLKWWLIAGNHDYEGDLASVRVGGGCMQQRRDAPTVPFGGDRLCGRRTSCFLPLLSELLSAFLLSARYHLPLARCSKCGGASAHRTRAARNGTCGGTRRR